MTTLTTHTEFVDVRPCDQHDNCQEVHWRTWVTSSDHADDYPGLGESARMDAPVMASHVSIDADIEQVTRDISEENAENLRRSMPAVVPLTIRGATIRDAVSQVFALRPASIYAENTND